MEKLVSIIIPTYNGAHRIESAIRSVINQSYKNWELLIIDDGSKDNTREIVSLFAGTDKRIRYIKNENNLGIQKTLNKGLHEAQGEYIARIDDDDIWNDIDKLEQQVNFLNEATGRVLVGTGVIIVDEEGKEMIRYLLPTSDTSIRAKLLGKNCFVHSSVMFRKDIALSVGGYDETISTRHIEDYDLWLKLGTLGSLGNIPSYAVTFTLRDQGLSSRNKLWQAVKALALAKKYKKNYPNFFSSYVRSLIRIVVYGVILQFPIKLFVNRLAKWYKENW